MGKPIYKSMAFPCPTGLVLTSLNWKFWGLILYTSILPVLQTGKRTHLADRSCCWLLQTSQSTSHWGIQTVLEVFGVLYPWRLLLSHLPASSHCDLFSGSLRLFLSCLPGSSGQGYTVGIESGSHFTWPVVWRGHDACGLVAVLVAGYNRTRQSVIQLLSVSVLLREGLGISCYKNRVGNQGALLLLFLANRTQLELGLAVELIYHAGSSWGISEHEQRAFPSHWVLWPAGLYTSEIRARPTRSMGEAFMQVWATLAVVMWWGRKQCMKLRGNKERSGIALLCCWSSSRLVWGPFLVKVCWSLKIMVIHGCGAKNKRKTQWYAELFLKSYSVKNSKCSKMACKIGWEIPNVTKDAVTIMPFGKHSPDWCWTYHIQRGFNTQPIKRPRIKHTSDGKGHLNTAILKRALFSA